MTKLDAFLLLLSVALIVAAGFSLSCTGQGCEKEYPAYQSKIGKKP